MARTRAAYLRDTQALSQLSLALGKFATGVQEAMTQTDAEIRRTQEWLLDRIRHWQRQVTQARQEVQAAQHALYRCQSSIQYDRDGRPIPPDCSAEMAHLSYCRHKLQQAEEELHTVKKWQARMGQAVSQYQNIAKRMRDVTTTITRKGQSFLNQKITEIESYDLGRVFSGVKTPTHFDIKDSLDVQGLYSNLKDLPSVGPGKRFTPSQRAQIIAENKKRNGGVVKSDLSGKVLVPPQKTTRGVVPKPNEWQIDHIKPRSKGGPNSYSNSQVLSREENRAKSDMI